MKKYNYLLYSHLYEWYEIFHRSLPWREINNAYHIWLSEVILQQTRVAQGMDYYLRFIARWPRVGDLAAAEEAAKIQEAAAALGHTGDNLGQQVADFALQFVGNPYVYGGTSLTNGADCSGFTLAVYSNFGVALPHSAAAQNKKGTNVGSVANAIPGDLIYYSGHIGIYIGNEQIVHAGNSRTGIIVSNVYYDKVLGVRRIF